MLYVSELAAHYILYSYIAVGALNELNSMQMLLSDTLHPHVWYTVIASFSP